MVQWLISSAQLSVAWQLKTWNSPLSDWVGHLFVLSVSSVQIGYSCLTAASCKLQAVGSSRLLVLVVLLDYMRESSFFFFSHQYSIPFVVYTHARVTLPGVPRNLPRFLCGVIVKHSRSTWLHLVCGQLWPQSFSCTRSCTKKISSRFF